MPDYSEHDAHHPDDPGRPECTEKTSSPRRGRMADERLLLENWLRLQGEVAGKGVANNLDGRALVRAAEALATERQRAEAAEAEIERMKQAVEPCDICGAAEHNLRANKAEAENQKLRGLLWYAWSEMNAIRAETGVPCSYDGHRKGISEDYWSDLVDAMADALGDEAKPWPSDAARAALQSEALRDGAVQVPRPLSIRRDYGYQVVLTYKTAEQALCAVDVMLGQIERTAAKKAE